MSEPNAIIDLHDKLKEQDKQIERELKDNNGLRKVIGIQDRALKDVNEFALRNQIAELEDIVKKKNEEILKL